ARLAGADGRRCFVLGLAASVQREQVTALLERAAKAGGPSIEVVEGLTYEVMAGAHALLIASGTATLEAALLGAPMVVCYRVSRLTELMARALKRSRWISLPNIIAGRGAVPEILQDDVTGAPVIYVVWHARLLVLPYLFRGRGLWALVSRSEDGEMLADFVRRFGFVTVRGSSSRGGGEGLRSLIRAIRKGHSVVVVPDGPR